MEQQLHSVDLQTCFLKNADLVHHPLYNGYYDDYCILGADEMGDFTDLIDSDDCSDLLLMIEELFVELRRIEDPFLSGSNCCFNVEAFFSLVDV